MKYNTNRREEIVAFLMNNHERAYTAEELSAAVLDGGRGKSTVYRLLSELVASGCVRRIADGETRRVSYQYVGDEHCHHHLHLKCKGCGRLIHLDEGTSREVEARLSSSGFTIDGGELLLGTCADCGGNG